MRRGLSMAVIALSGLSAGFVVAMETGTRFGDSCAPEHPVPGKSYPHTVTCLTGAAFAAETARLAARDAAERKADTAQQGPVMAFLRGRN